MYRVTSPAVAPGALPGVAPSGYPVAPDPSLTHRLGGFEIERTPSRMPTRLPEEMPQHSRDEESEEEIDLPTAVQRLFAAKNTPLAISGKIPINPEDHVLYFRSVSGATHTLKFPIDIEYDPAPALDVLLTTCRPAVESPYVPTTEPGALVYPSDFAFGTTIDLAERPVLDAVQASLLPSLPPGNHVIAVRERLELLATGARRRPQLSPQDGRVATLVLSLPSRFKGGELLVGSPATGRQERFRQKDGKKPGAHHIHWVAYLEGSEHEIEPIRKGCRMDVYYAIHLKTFGYAGPVSDPLFTPSEDFRTMLGTVLNLSRGRKIGFYLSRDYNVSPSENIAETLVPLLSGGDAILYHALRMYELAPTLQWTAGGYIWPVDRVVDMNVEPSPSWRGSGAPPVRGTFGHSGAPADEAEALRARVEVGGGTPLSQADIMVLADWDPAGQGSMSAVGKVRVPFVSNGELGRLVVNVLLVVFVV